MRRAPAVLALWVVAAAARAEELPQAPVRPLAIVEGNVALPEGVYRSVLDLPSTAEASPQTAKLVAARVRRFLRRAGYDLATVEAEVRDGHIVVRVDEGRLDKIVFVGEGLLPTFRLKFELSLPGKVFNRGELERQLREFAERFQLRSIRWELMPIADAPVPGVQLSDLSVIKDLPFLQPGRPYELRIFVQPQSGRPGFSPQIEIDSLEGGGVGVEYSGGPAGPGLFSAGGRVSGEVRNHLQRPGSNIALSRIWVEGRWSAPISLFFAPKLVLRADVLDRQRGDLLLDSFRLASVGGAALLESHASPFLSASAGFGVLRRWLVTTDPVGPPLQVVSSAPGAQTRGFGVLSARFVTNPEELRVDQHHELTLSALGFVGTRGDHSVRVHGAFQTFVRRGWSEIWLRGSGTALSGFVPFFDEESLGAAMHGAFSGIFVRKLAGGELEYRLSLLRDLLKAGPWIAVQAFGDIDRDTDRERARGATAFGLAFHGLVFDELGIDVYAGYGALLDGRCATPGLACATNSIGVALSIRQVY